MTSQRHAAWGGFLTLLMASALGGAAPLAQAADQDAEPSTQSAAEPGKRLSAAADKIIDRTNGFRQSKGKSALQTSQPLEQAAQSFADYMARTDRYGHHADGSDPAARAKEHDYHYCIIAENIAYEVSPAKLSRSQIVEQVMEGWRESPEHRENMLDPDVTQIGVGAARSDSSGRIYLVQELGRPRSARVDFEVQNTSDTRVDYDVGDQRYPLPAGYTRLHARCRPEPLTIHWPNRSTDRTLHPANGEHYRITRAESGDLRLEEQ